jgi:hypothetical protein|tara:strand:- start:241 stop:447 length:207 start_codon:yes stop_codon:yes gene_type:complete
MSAQFKLDQNSSPDQAKEKSEENKISKRPNIDHLLKKISEERKLEKRNNFIILVFVMITIGLVSIYFL